MKCGTIKKRIRVSWSSRSGVLKLKVDGAAKGKLGLIGIRGMLLNSKERGAYCLCFLKVWESENPMKQRCLPFWKLCRFFLQYIYASWLWRLESDSAHMIYWASHNKLRTWKLQLYFNEIKWLSSHIQVDVCHDVGLANSISETWGGWGYSMVASVM